MANSEQHKCVLYKVGILSQAFFVLCAFLVANEIVEYDLPVFVYVTIIVGAPVWSLYVLKWIAPRLEMLRSCLLFISLHVVVSLPAYLFFQDDIDLYFTVEEITVFSLIQVCFFAVFYWLGNVKKFSGLFTRNVVRNHVKKALQSIALFLILPLSLFLLFQFVAQTKEGTQYEIGNRATNYFKQEGIKAAKADARHCMAALKAAEGKAKQNPELYSAERIRSLMGVAMVASEYASEPFRNEKPHWDWRGVTRCKTLGVSAQHIVIITNIMKGLPEKPRESMARCYAAYTYNLHANAYSGTVLAQKEYDLGKGVALAKGFYPGLKEYDFESVAIEAQPYYTEIRKAGGGIANDVWQEMRFDCLYFGIPIK